MGLVQYTSIILTDNGTIVSVRSHRGHMNEQDIGCYLDGVDPTSECMVLFHHVDLYSDVGESASRVFTFKANNDGWIRL